MNEEIDIIELLQRVKEGKAPKEIEIEGRKYRCSIVDEIYNYTRLGLDGMYFDLVDDYSLFDIIDTKIKILDKPIIEELPTTEIVPNFDGTTTITVQKAYSTDELADKINEIIRVINNKE